jgi:DNA-binding MurR/RpiR family transcriptional regulator
LDETVAALATARRVAIFGTGSSYIVGLDLAEKLKRLGINAQIEANDYIQAITAAGLDEDSVAIGISYSGETRSTIEHLHMAREQGARAIAITNFADSTIIQLADVVITTAVSRHLFPDGGMGGRIAQLFVIDVLYMRLFASDVARFGAAYRRYNQILLNKAAHPRDRSIVPGSSGPSGADGATDEVLKDVEPESMEGTR